jgi:hypothetical protein
MSAQGLDLEIASDTDVANLTKWFANPVGNKKIDQEHARMAISFINDYTTSDKPDLMKIKFRPESDIFWSISSESLDAMQQELHKSSEQNVTLSLRVHLEFVRGRSDITKEPLVHTADYFIDVKPQSKLSSDLQKAIKSPGSVVSQNFESRKIIFILRSQLKTLFPTICSYQTKEKCRTPKFCCKL